MSLRMLAAGFVTALPLALSAPTVAADLYDPYAPKYSGSPYDDPRYAELYGKPKPYHRPYADRAGRGISTRLRTTSISSRFDPGPLSVTRSLIEEFDDSSDRPRWRKKPDFEPYHPKKACLPPADCLSRRELRRELVRDRLVETSATSRSAERPRSSHARRPNGTLYRLEVDRCAGEVVSAERLDGHRDSSHGAGAMVYPTY